MPSEERTHDTDTGFVYSTLPGLRQTPATLLISSAIIHGTEGSDRLKGPELSLNLGAIVALFSPKPSGEFPRDIPEKYRCFSAKKLLLSRCLRIRAFSSSSILPKTSISRLVFLKLHSINSHAESETDPGTLMWLETPVYIYDISVSKLDPLNSSSRLTNARKEPSYFNLSRSSKQGSAGPIGGPQGAERISFKGDKNSQKVGSSKAVIGCSDATWNLAAKPEPSTDSQQIHSERKSRRQLRRQRVVVRPLRLIAYKPYIMCCIA